MKHIELKISKKAGFWKYKVEIELNLQPQSQAPYIKEIVVSGYYGTYRTRIDEDEDSVILRIADSKLYHCEDPMDSSYDYAFDLCSPMYLTKPYQRKVKFYLKYDIDINEVVSIFESLDDIIDRMVQAPGTPAFNYVHTKTKYIKLEISKRAGFWRYKVGVELNLQPQSQISYIKKISIGGASYHKVTKTGINEIQAQDWVILGIVDSKLYSYEDPENNKYVDLYNLCPSMYLAKLYQQKVGFYLEYNIDINKVIKAFENLDNEIDKMLQAPGTPAFNCPLIEMKYIKLKISKKAGFWRYRIEVEINLQPQPQASYIKFIYVRGFCSKSKTEIIEMQYEIFIDVAGSEIFEYENPGNCSNHLGVCLCSAGYLIKSYQDKTVFCLEHNVDINEVIEAFRNLDDMIDRMVQAPGTPAFNYVQTKTKYIKLEISKRAGFWRYKVKVKLCLQQKTLTKDIYILGTYSSNKTASVDVGSDYLQLTIVGSNLYEEEKFNSEYIYRMCLYCRKNATQVCDFETEFFLEYDCNIDAVVKSFEVLDDEISKVVV